MRNLWKSRNVVLAACCSMLALGTARATFDDHSPEYQRGVELGRKEAEAQLKAGAATIYTLGGFVGRRLDILQVDQESGLPIQTISGCVVSDQIMGRLKGHNQKIQESIQSGKLPKNSSKPWLKDLKNLHQTFSSWSKTQKTEVLRAGDPARFSLDRTMQMEVLVATYDRQDRSGSVVSAVLTGNDGQKHQVSLGEAEGQIEWLWGPKGSSLALVRLNGADGKRTVRALDTQVGLWLLEQQESSESL